jgi:hypothetical protein
MTHFSALAQRNGFFVSTVVFRKFAAVCVWSTASNNREQRSVQHKQILYIDTFYLKPPPLAHY